MPFFESFQSPGACQCLPPQGGVDDGKGQARRSYMPTAGGDTEVVAINVKPHKSQFVDHRNFVMTGTSVYQNVIFLQVALCLVNLFVTKAYYKTLSFDDKVGLMLLPHVHITVAALFGLMSVNSVTAVDVRVQDIVSVRYVALLGANLCCIASEFFYILKDNPIGQFGWFVSCILLHRCYEITLPNIEVFDPASTKCGVSPQAQSAKAFNTLFLKMLSLFTVLLFYIFMVGMAVASEKTMFQAVYSFGYLAFVLLILEMSLARLIFKALSSQQDRATLAALFLLLSCHIFAYSRHLSSANYRGGNNDFNILARFLEYCAQMVIFSSVMKFNDKIQYTRVDYQ